jgi:hypothetical protein
MTKIQQQIEDNEKEFDEKFPSACSEAEGCFLTDIEDSYHYKPYKTEEIKSHLRTSQLKLLEAVREEIEEAVQQERKRIVKLLKDFPTGMFDSTPYLKDLINKILKP